MVNMWLGVALICYSRAFDNVLLRMLYTPYLI
jgi:hypothetical protein